MMAHGQKLGLSDQNLVETLQTQGFRVQKLRRPRWKLEEAPDPFEGFKEYYATPPRTC